MYVWKGGTQDNSLLSLCGPLGAMELKLLGMAASAIYHQLISPACFLFYAGDQIWILKYWASALPLSCVIPFILRQGLTETPRVALTYFVAQAALELILLSQPSEYLE